nr:terminase family protein [Govania unica]
MAPAGDWFCWLILAGRGFGKTRSGAEWLRGLVEGGSPLRSASAAVERIALVAETWSDARDVMVEGESGLLATARPGARPKFEPSKRRLTWPNGAVAQIYSADEPDQLRGPQHSLAWCDELAKWRHADLAWANLLMGLRLGVRPRVMVTTTPRPMPLLKNLMTASSSVVTRGATRDNAANLPPSFMVEMTARYGGTRLGRQELEAEILEDVPGALWTRGMIETARVAEGPGFARIVVAVDPPVTSGERADACGIVVAAKGEDGRAYVLADLTVKGATPLEWARAAVAAYADYGADRLVAEVNNGGELVAAVLRQVDPTVSYRAVRASRGKAARAEPVAALYEQGRVHHMGSFPALEDQMCCFVAGEAWAGEGSPDRVDALVWAVTDLMLGPGGMPRFRSL